MAVWTPIAMFQASIRVPGNKEWKTTILMYIQSSLSLCNNQFFIEVVFYPISQKENDIAAL